MDVFFVLAGWLVMLFFVTHDAYLAWFEPKKYIETLRKRRFRTLKLFPFFRIFLPYVDEGFILQSNKVMLPILIVFLVSGLVFIVIQIIITIK